MPTLHPLNEEAIAEQKRHCDAVDNIMVELHGLMGQIKEKIRQEQKRWQENLLAAMPELEALKGQAVKITDDGKFYYKDSKEDAVIKPPAWINDIMKEIRDDPH